MAPSVTRGGHAVRAGAGAVAAGVVAGLVQEDVVAAVSKAGGPKLDRRLVTLPAPIKALGNHTVTVKVHPEVEATLTLEVVAAK